MPGQNDYDARHRELREWWKAKVEAGGVPCWRCRLPIAPREPWDLGHDDYDRNRYRGPEHRGCNRATAGRDAGTETTPAVDPPAPFDASLWD